MLVSGVYLCAYMNIGVLCRLIWKIDYCHIIIFTVATILSASIHRESSAIIFSSPSVRKAFSYL